MRRDPSFDTRPPLVIGHRGAMGLAPENTMAGFQIARQQKADGVEFDVMLCKSGEVVVFHDATVDRLTDGSGRVAEMPLSHLKDLDAGAHHGDEFLGERIPTLPEVLDALGDTMFLNIELKGQTREHDGLEAKVAFEVKRRNLLDHVFVSSFNPARLWRIKRALPGVRIGMLYQPNMAVYMRRLWFRFLLRPWSINPPVALATPAQVAKFHRKGYRLMIWNANDIDEFDLYCRYGVAGIITDFPNKAAPVVARYADAPRPPATRVLTA